MNKLTVLVPLIFFLVCCKNNPGKEIQFINELKQLSSPADSASAEPYLFTDNKGTVYLSWIEKRGKQSFLKFSVLSDTIWSVPVEIATGTQWFVNWADYPIIVTDGNDNLLAHFLEKSDTAKFTYDVKLVSSDDKGKTWSDAKILHDDGKKAEHGFVSLIPYKDQYFVSWLDGRNAASETGTGQHEGHHGEMTLRAALLDKNGIKTQEWELDNRVCDCCQTSAAFTDNGPVVVYRDRSADEIRDMSIVRYIDGQWTSPAIIHPDQWKIAGCPVNGPRADAIKNNLAIAWFSMADEKGRVNIVFSEDGGASFGKPIRIDEGQPIGRVDIVMLDSGTAMVSWMEGAVIKAVKVSKNGEKETPVLIASSSISRSSGFPQMTRAGNKLIFAWTDENKKSIRVGSLAL